MIRKMFTLLLWELWACKRFNAGTLCLRTIVKTEPHIPDAQYYMFYTYLCVRAAAQIVFSEAFAIWLMAYAHIVVFSIVRLVASG